MGDVKISRLLYEIKGRWSYTFRHYYTGRVGGQ
jgi:hypothetical protein